LEKLAHNELAGRCALTALRLLPQDRELGKEPDGAALRKRHRDRVQRARGETRRRAPLAPESTVARVSSLRIARLGATSMKQRTYDLVNVLLTLAGVLFSGYLSALRFLSSTCFADEPCPFFLGYPACYFGFGLFSALFITSVLASARKIPTQIAHYALRTLSLGGTLFAGYFVVQEFVRDLASGFAIGPLGLPTCAYGLVFFLTIFAFSFRYPSTQEHESPVQRG
jgi:hypothetical protein